jgi:hypothetical protein
MVVHLNCVGLLTTETIKKAQRARRKIEKYKNSAVPVSSSLRSPWLNLLSFKKTICNARRRRRESGRRLSKRLRRYKAGI